MASTGRSSRLSGLSTLSSLRECQGTFWSRAPCSKRSARRRRSPRKPSSTVEDLKGMVASGMEEGARETIERFAELVQEMKHGKQGSRARGRDLEMDLD